MADPKLGDLRTTSEVAAMAGIHPGSLRKRLCEGRSDAILFAGRYYFTSAQAAEVVRVVRPHRKRKEVNP